MNTINSTYLDLLQALLEAGPRESRGLAHRELRAPTVVDIPGNGLVTLASRKLSYTFAIIERMSYLSGRGFYPNATIAYAKNYKRFIEPGGYDRGAYGQRMAPQLRRAWSQLDRDPHTRQAVVNVYNHLEDGRKDKMNTPCTLALHFMQGHDGSLELVAYMRSNDILWGFPYDVSAFRFLQQVMAHWLGWEVGSYTHVATSLHLYERDVERAQAMVDAGCGDVLTRVGTHPSTWDLTIEDTAQAMAEFWEAEEAMRHGVLRPTYGSTVAVSSCLMESLEALQRKWTKHHGGA